MRGSGLSSLDEKRAETDQSRRTLKIGFSSFVMQSGFSGISTYIRELLRRLGGEGCNHQIEVLTPSCDEALLPKAREQLSHLSVPSRYRSPLAALMWHNIHLPKIAREKEYDLVHIPTYRRIPYLKGCPTIATVHDLAAITYREKYDALRTFFNVRVVPRLLDRCDHIVTVSEHTKKDIMRYSAVPEERISVIYSGIDHQVYRPMKADKAWGILQKSQGIDKPFLVYVSRIEHPGKNHFNLIRAFEAFKRRCRTPHQLILAGANWHGADKVKRRAAESEYAEDIHLLGFIPLEEIVALYSVCDLIVHPSYFEGFGFPVVEGAACGAPVICSNNSSLGELGAMGGFRTFDPTSYQEIHTAIEESVAGEENRQQRVRSLEFAKQFDWDRSMQQLLDVYDRVV